MPTIQQLVRRGRLTKHSVSRTPASKTSPQHCDVCTRVHTTTSKKSNSTLRKATCVRLSTSIGIATYIPGEGHSLQERSIMLVRGGRVEGLLGVRYHVMYGALDTQGVKGRRQARSKYGAKKEKR